MKTIEITDELYNKLIELANEVKTQDNRSTANVFFQIEDVELVPAWEGRSDLETLYSPKRDADLNGLEEMKEHCIDYYIEELDSTEEEAKVFFESYTESDFRDYLIYELDFEPLAYEYKKVYKNAFLTAKECERHLKNNAHHYTEKARSFGSCAWRNKDIEIIHEFLKSI